MNLYVVEALLPRGWTACQALNQEERQITAVYFSRDVAEDDLKEWKADNSSTEYRVKTVSIQGTYVRSLEELEADENY